MFITSLLNFDLENLENYCQIMETSLKNQKKNFEEWLEKEAEKLSEEEKEEFYDFYSDDYWELSNVFPNTLRSSLLVAAYSVLERQLVACCTELWNKNQYPVKPNIPQRRIIFEARNYLITHAGISIPDTSPNWSGIVSYNKIRNSIVHNGGKLNSQRLADLQPFLALNPSITLDQFHGVVLGEDACKNFIKIVRNLFFDEIFKASGK